MGYTIGLIKGVTRTSDYSSCYPFLRNACPEGVSEFFQVSLGEYIPGILYILDFPGTI